MPESKKIQLKVDRDTEKTRASNYQLITHTPEEFIVDFIHIHPTFNTGRLLSRLSLNPRDAKALYIALGQNLDGFEKKFGPITARSPRKEIGFQVENQSK